MSKRGYSAVILPAGYFDPAGARHTCAMIRPMRGSEEDWAATLAPGESQATFVTELLSRVVHSIGPPGATGDIIRELHIADREYLLLQLFEVSFGPCAELTLTCPAPQCRSKIDASFEIRQIPVEPGRVSASYRLAGTDVL